jgi:hypothetical protein
MAALVVAAWLPGCYVQSGRPIYPDSWPSILAPDPRSACPDISGTYRALSDEAPPLAYAPGKAPHNAPFGSPTPAPPLGRRVLTWHLAGTGKGEEEWAALVAYAGSLDADVFPSGRGEDPDWVRVQRLPGGLIEVQAGLREQTSVQFAIRESSGWWESFTGAAQTYQCQEGGLTLWGGFQPPPVENPSGDTRGASAKCTFSKAADGSLVMLEEPYVGVPRGTMSFNKWWRWRQIEQPERATRPPPPEGLRDP